jgi:hypothetical protein
MYHEFADWFHLVTAPEDYAEEAEFYFGLAKESFGRAPRSWLELGSGGGNNASQYKAWVQGPVVLSDRSEEMLSLSRSINPELEHVQGDMTSVRLGRQFEVVFVHDAASYLTTEEQVHQLAETAHLHCALGGIAILCPDDTAENVSYGTSHGGHDGDGRAIRYLEWSTPGRPGTFEVNVDFVYVFHEEGKPPRVELDRHINGALPRNTWLSALSDAGFAQVWTTHLVHSEVEPGQHEVFLARR